MAHNKCLAIITIINGLSKREGSEIIRFNMNYKSSILKWSLKTYESFLGNANELEKCSGYEFAFPAFNASAKTIIHGLTEHPIYHHGISQSIASEQETHFTKNEMQQGAQCSWNSPVLPYSPPP